ncbi:hypothetical protein AB0M86_46160 [Streptomyces sp. NPDC051639]|uniref:hypothetical protein n=1 Tax=Streptomyces sp. NPDC051639 TaxID=3155671 RepID=UPI00343B6E86
MLGGNSLQGWRTRWIENGGPDDQLHGARRLGILGLGRVRLLGSLYVVLCAGIDLLIER